MRPITILCSLFLLAAFTTKNERPVEIREWNILSDNFKNGCGAINASRDYKINHLELSHHIKKNIPNLGGDYGLLGAVMEWTSSPGAAKAQFNDKNGKKQILAYPIARRGLVKYATQSDFRFTETTTSWKPSS